MFAGGELNKKQLAELRQALASLELPPKKRQRLLWRLAKYGLIAAAKRNVRNQQSPDGQPWPGRRTKRRGKMLRNMPKLLHIREMPEIAAVRVYLQGGGYRNGESPVPAGVVGYAQQNGMTMRINRSGKARGSIGTGSTNTLTMLLDTIDLLAELAQQCAGHTHPGTGAPNQASAFTETASKAGVTRGKYEQIIA